MARGEETREEYLLRLTQERFTTHPDADAAALNRSGPTAQWEREQEKRREEQRKVVVQIRRSNKAANNITKEDREWREAR